jgi:hypothetical protein
MSISVTSFVLGVVGVSFIFSAYYLASVIIHLIFIGWDPLKYNKLSTGALLSGLLIAAILLIPIGTAFWMTFKKLDIRPLKSQLKFYYYIAVPTISAFYIFIILFFKKFTERSG